MDIMLFLFLLIVKPVFCVNNDGFPKLVHFVYGLWDNAPVAKNCTDDKAKCMNMRSDFYADFVSCREYSKDFEVKLWDPESMENLILEKEPWFLNTWKSYKYPVQRADSVRYIILYHYGGIYMDLDIECKNQLSHLIKTIESKNAQASLAFKETSPFGLTNSFMIAKKQHPFMRYVINQLQPAAAALNWPFIPPYVAVMFCTGSLYLSLRFDEYAEENKFFLTEVYYLTHIEYTQVYFKHHKGSTWHSFDGKAIVWLNNAYKNRGRSFLISMALLFSILSIGLYFYRKAFFRLMCVNPFITLLNFWHNFTVQKLYPFGQILVPITPYFKRLYNIKYVLLKFKHSLVVTVELIFWGTKVAPVKTV